MTFLSLTDNLEPRPPSVQHYDIAAAMAQKVAALAGSVSLFSALAEHEMIEQIPRQISLVSLARPRRILTSLGTYAVHQLTPELFGGFEGDERSGYLARPEKALFDLVYVRAAAGSRAYPPELSLPDDFDRSELSRWSERIGSQRFRTLVDRRLRELLGQAA